MLEQNRVKILTIEKDDLANFNPEHIFECGQCFRWNKIDSNYIGVALSRVIEIVFERDTYIIYSSLKADEINLIKKDSKKLEQIVLKIKDEIIEYFDLSSDYTFMKKQILNSIKGEKFEKEFKQAVEFGYGIRILNQENFETIISYIISANNNIPRIKKIIEKISENYGRKIKYCGKTYYAFPNLEELKNVTKEDYRKLGAGFRDIRLEKTIKKINENGINKYIENKESLKELSGVGDKVAECIMLFSLKKKNTFPIDVWVRRVINDIYFKYTDEKKLKRKDLEKFGEKYFSGFSGLAQQYLFYWRRNSDKKILKED